MPDVLQDWLKSDQIVGRLRLMGEDEIQKVESEIGSRMPEPLRQLLLTDGAPEGFLGESYIRFFSAGEIGEWWCQAQETIATGFVPFASNGGGELYGYDSRSPQRPFVLLPMIGVAWDDAFFLGLTWNEFVDVLKNGNLFERRYVLP